jgi:hypothetical protein
LFLLVTHLANIVIEYFLTVTEIVYVVTTLDDCFSYMMMHIKPDGPIYQVKIVSVRAELALNRSTSVDCASTVKTLCMENVKCSDNFASSQSTEKTKPPCIYKGSFCANEATSTTLGMKSRKYSQDYVTSAAPLDTACKTVSLLLGTGSQVEDHAKSSAVAKDIVRSSYLESVYRNLAGGGDFLSGRCHNQGNVCSEASSRMAPANTPDMLLKTNDWKTEHLQTRSSKVPTNSDVDVMCSKSSLQKTVDANFTCAHVVSDRHFT